MSSREPDPAPPRVAAVMTCFNRKPLTLAAIAAAEVSARHAGVHLDVFLVDDGSTDGTAAAVRARFPDATVIAGNGSLYWNQGMRLAWTRAQTSGADFYLLLNDDLQVVEGAIGNALAAYRAAVDPSGGPVVVGRTVDPHTGEQTYGGYRRASASSRLRFRHLADDESDCDTMTGNFVLVPAAVMQAVGILDSHYSHGFGDIDYGLRVRRAGFRVVELKPPVGEQEDNARHRQFGGSMTLSTLRFTLTHPKGVPVREWLYFCKEHAGIRWPINFGYRYLKMAFRGMAGR